MIMSSKITALLLAAIATGVISGWMSSQTQSPKVSDNVAWKSFESSLAEQEDVLTTSNQIKASGIIRKFLSPKEKQEAERVKVKDDGTPPLPEIIGTSVVNGIAQVHIKMPDAPPISLVQGDSLESGWLLESVNLNGIVLKYEDIEQTVLVREYDLTPE